MKHLFAVSILLLLAACSSEPSGTYASATKDGQVLRDSASGRPYVTITLDKGNVVVRKAGDADDRRPRLGSYKYVDNIVYMESGSSIVPLHVEGDLLLVPEGAGEFMAFKKL